MGLDMYLRAQKYVAGYRYMREANMPEVNQYDRLVELFGMGEFAEEDSPGAHAEFTIGYWRKANHIHNWFVQNVQEGEDECRPWYVDREKLEELRETCLRVLSATDLEDGRVHVGTRYSDEGTEELYESGQVVVDSSTAEELLPTEAGFFFGNTDYDEWYIEDVRRTVRIIDRALALPGEWAFIYQSSW